MKNLFKPSRQVYKQMESFKKPEGQESGLASSESREDREAREKKEAAEEAISYHVKRIDKSLKESGLSEDSVKEVKAEYEGKLKEMEEKLQNMKGASEGEKAEVRIRTAMRLNEKANNIEDTIAEKKQEEFDKTRENQRVEGNKRYEQNMAKEKQEAQERLQKKAEAQIKLMSKMGEKLDQATKDANDCIVWRERAKTTERSDSAEDFYYRARGLASKSFDAIMDVTSDMCHTRGNLLDREDVKTARQGVINKYEDAWDAYKKMQKITGYGVPGGTYRPF